MAAIIRCPQHRLYVLQLTDLTPHHLPSRHMLSYPIESIPDLLHVMGNRTSNPPPDALHTYSYPEGTYDGDFPSAHWRGWPNSRFHTERHAWVRPTHRRRRHNSTPILPTHQQDVTTSLTQQPSVPGDKEEQNVSPSRQSSVVTPNILPPNVAPKRPHGAYKKKVPSSVRSSG